MSATTVVGLSLAGVAAIFVLLVVDKLGLLSRQRKRRRANLKRARARLH